MTDIVERLRGRAESYRQSGPSAEHTAKLLDEAAYELGWALRGKAEAAAELERLRAEVERLTLEWKHASDGWATEGIRAEAAEARARTARHSAFNEAIERAAEIMRPVRPDDLRLIAGEGRIPAWTINAMNTILRNRAAAIRSLTPEADHAGDGEGFPKLESAGLRGARQVAKNELSASSPPPSVPAGWRAGELCTFGPPGERERQWLLRFEDADRGDCYFENEREAVEFFIRARDNWNCTLYATVALSASPPAPVPGDGVGEDEIARLIDPGAFTEDDRDQASPTERLLYRENNDARRGSARNKARNVLSLLHGRGK